MQQIGRRQIPPFLKWAGGKRWLVSSHPGVLPGKFNRYIEPFLGSGAVYFHLLPRGALLTDVNCELINVYKVIRDSWQDLEAELDQHQKKHSDTHYYAVRSDRTVDPVGNAARFIYLNRTCWNGLYRVNKKGEFNVPRGTKDSVVMGTDDFKGVSALLQNATIKVADFEDSINSAGGGDFVFVDPPYTVKHNHNGFLKYNDKIFSWEDQVRLRDSLERADERGVLIVMTNANHKSVRELYLNFNQRKLHRHSVLAGKVDGRGATEELLVTNFK